MEARGRLLAVYKSDEGALSSLAFATFKERP